MACFSPYRPGTGQHPEAQHPGTRDTGVSLAEVTVGHSPGACCRTISERSCRWMKSTRPPAPNNRRNQKEQGSFMAATRNLRLLQQAFSGLHSARVISGQPCERDLGGGRGESMSTPATGLVGPSRKKCCKPSQARPVFNILHEAHLERVLIDNDTHQ